jgi:CheY-like chemotaxis protein/REP element-mobilizing transposase RayT
MATRVLIINRQLVFAVTLKQALEQTGVYEVHPFTAADAALEYLLENPQEIALVDFTLPGTTGPALVDRLRAVQPNLLIIASPRPAEATEVMRSLRLQGMINAPFSVRDIVPVIEQALENRQQDVALFGDDTTESGNVIPRAKTRILDDEAPGDEEDWPEIQTRIFEDPPRGQTAILDDDPYAAPPTPSKTKILDDESPQEDVYDQTNLVSDVPAPEEKFYGETRILDDEPVGSAPGGATWQSEEFDEPEPGGETPQFRRPGMVPEISNLDSVLANLADASLFEPPTKEGDTPAVPTKDSDALRQFLATAGDFGREANFDDVLEAIEPGQVDKEGERKPSDFDNLVQSMASSEPHTALPDRQQQFMDFILTSGMDAVLQEIEKVKTGTLRQYVEPPSEEDAASTFQRLAGEEPPMPTLEESGTIGDLMIGVSDRSFRNVLAVLRGEEAGDEGESSRLRTIAEEEQAEVLARFYEPMTDVELPVAEPAEIPEPPSLPEMPVPKAPPEYSFDEQVIEEQPGDSTLAQMILETTLDENTLGFPIEELMSNIENRLSVYRPDIQPLPSWGPAFERRKREEEKLIREPDFLPEELPPPEELPSGLPELEVTDRFNIETTKPSSRQVIESHPEDIETDLFEQSVQARQVAEDTPTRAPDWLEEEEAREFTPLPPADEAPRVEPWDEEIPLDEPPFDFGAVEEDAWQAEETRVSEGIEAWPAEEMPVSEAEDAGEWTVEHASAVDDWVVQEEFPAEETIASEPGEFDWGEAAPIPETAFEPPAEVAEPIAEAPVASDDARIAQLALNLTQASLELTAEATLLTSQGEVVASAGHLAPEDLEELSRIIANDWEAHDEGARIRYINLPSSGRDYMLYSLKTDEGFTLSLIFAGTTPLRIIRRQGQRLAGALQAVPEESVEEAQAAPLMEAIAPPAAVEETPLPVAVRQPPEVKVLTAYTYVWILRDPNMQLSQSAQQAIHAGLSVQLGEVGWRVKARQVAEDHVYLLADVPGDTPAQQIVRELKRRSAEIARAQNPTLDAASLWADSYFVLTPGRELDMDEIAEFINFERM